MNSWKLIAIVTASAFATSAYGKVWCDFGAKGGYYAEKCPANAKAQEVPPPAPEPERWEPKIGMTSYEVERHTESKDCWNLTPIQWCGSHKVNKTETASGTREQWVFGIGYLYFSNGVLAAIQDER